MKWLVTFLLVWLFGWFATLGSGIVRDLWLARLERQPAFLRAWCYRSVPALITWPLYLILVVRDLYILSKLTRKR